MARSTQYQKYWRRTLIQLHGGKCEHKLCSETDPDILQFAHVHGKETPLSKIPRGRGGWQRMVDVFDHPDCYVLLCKDHHLEYDKSK